MGSSVVETLIVNVTVKFKELTKGTKQIESKMKKLSKSLKNTGNNLGLVFGGHEILNGIKNVVKASNEFESELAKLNNIANLSKKDLKGVGDAAQSLASQFGISSNDIVHGLTELNKLGYKASESLKEMPALLKFTASSGSKFNTTVTLLETTMNDFHKQLKDTAIITDVFTAAMGKANNLTGQDLADAFKKAGAAAYNSGASIANLTAATVLLARKGFSGAEAGTALNAIFGNITKSGGTADKALKGLGISVTTSTGQMRPFSEVATDIQNKLQGMTSDQKNFFAQQIAGKEHMAKLLAIVGGAPGSFAELSASLENSSGATEKAFKGIDETAQRSIDKLSTSFETFQQKVGSSLGPIIKTVADALAGLLKWFNELSPQTQELIGYLGAAVGIFSVLAIVVGTAALAFSALSLPITLTIAVIALLVAAFIWLWNNMDTVTKAITDAWNGLGEFLSGLWDGIVAGVTAFGQLFVDLWDGIVNGVVDAFMWLYNHNYYFKDLVDTIVAVFNKAKSFISTVWNAIVTWLTSKWNALKSVASSAFNAVKNVISSIWKSISSTIQGWASKAYQWGANFLQMLIDGIKSKVSAIIKTVSSIGSSIAKFLGFHSPTDAGPLSQSDQWMPNFMNMMAQGLEMGIPKLQMAVMDVAASMDLIGAGATNSTTNINVYPRQANLDARGLSRELDRARWLNGGRI